MLNKIDDLEQQLRRADTEYLTEKVEKLERRMRDNVPDHVNEQIERLEARLRAKDDSVDQGALKLLEGQLRNVIEKLTTDFDRYKRDTNLQAERFESELKKLPDNMSSEKSHQIHMMNLKLDRMQTQIANLGAEAQTKKDKTSPPPGLDQSMYKVLANDIVA